VLFRSSCFNEFIDAKALLCVCENVQYTHITHTQDIFIGSLGHHHRPFFEIEEATRVWVHFTFWCILQICNNAPLSQRTNFFFPQWG
jgi:hypothetical protein